MVGSCSGVVMLSLTVGDVHCDRKSTSTSPLRLDLTAPDLTGEREDRPQHVADVADGARPDARLLEVSDEREDAQALDRAEWFVA